MIRRASTYLLVATFGLTAPAVAQTPPTVTEAIARVRAHNPDAGATAAAEREAVERLTQARAGYLPRVDVAESCSAIAARRHAGVSASDDRGKRDPEMGVRGV
jgi:outer membrane protein TolC